MTTLASEQLDYKYGRLARALPFKRDENGPVEELFPYLAFGH